MANVDVALTANGQRRSRGEAPADGGATGTTVTLTGTNFTGTTSVPSGDRKGTIWVRNPNGTATSKDT